MEGEKLFMYLRFEKGLYSLENMCTCAILLKYSTRNVSKKGEDLWLQKFSHAAIIIEIAHNVH